MRRASTRSGTSGHTDDRPGHWRMPGWLQVVVALAFLAVSGFIVWPQLPEGEQALDVLRQLSIPLVVLSFLLELASLAAYSMMTRLLVGHEGRPSYPTVLRIDLSALGLSHVAPAGAATSAALRLRLLVSSGLRPDETVAGVAVQATASNLVLGGVFLLGVGLAIATGSRPVGYLAAILLVLGFFAGTAVLAWLLVRHQQRLGGWLDAIGRRLPWAPTGAISDLLGSLHRRIRDLVLHPSSTAWVLGWSALNWLLDAAVLWVMLAAAGVRLAPGPLLTVYGFGNLIAILPLTPGGLGIVEGVMIPALVGFGVPRSAALVGVVGWRLWQFWMPMLLGALAYLSIRLGARRHRAAASDPGSAGEGS